MAALIDLTGRRFGRLTVLHRGGMRGTKPLWWCRCHCGVEKEVPGECLRTGRTTSCGCYRVELSTTHGLSRTRTYRAWVRMKTRCYDPSYVDFHRYGGRSDRPIKVYWKWIYDAEPLWQLLGECPPGYTLERLDNDGDYEPGNVVWATKKTQTRNRSITVKLYFAGATRPVGEWVERTGLKYSTILMRLAAGWSVEDTLTSKRYVHHNRQLHIQPQLN